MAGANMKPYPAALGLAAFVFLIMPTLWAGPLRDRYMDRTEGRSADNLEKEERPGGPITLPEGVRVERDIAYGADTAQRIDVYFPVRPKAAPILFMVHGGAWMVGDKATSRVVVNKMKRWVGRGFIMVSVNYRLSPQADPVEQANDVAKALAFAQSKAMTWGGDPARFVLMGHSAGAHLVALLAADPSIGKQQGAKPWLGTIALDSAAFDVPRIMQARHPRFYDRVFKDDPAYWRKASPIYRLSRVEAPMLLVCSSQRQDSCPQARNFAAKASAQNAKVTVLPVALSHSEINENLGVAGDYTEEVESFLRSIGIDSNTLDKR